MTAPDMTMPLECDPNEYIKMKDAFNAGLEGDVLIGGGDEATDDVIAMFKQAGRQVKQLKDEAIVQGGVLGILNTLADKVSTTANMCSQTALTLLIGEQVPYFAQTTWNAVITGFIAKETANIAMDNITPLIEMTGWTANKVAVIAALGALGITVDKMMQIAKRVTDAGIDRATVEASGITGKAADIIESNTVTLIDAIKKSPTEMVETADDVTTDAVAMLNPAVEDAVIQLVNANDKTIGDKRPRDDVDEDDNAAVMKLPKPNEGDNVEGPEVEGLEVEGLEVEGGKRKSQKKQQKKKQKQQKSQKKPKRKLSKSKRAKKAKKQSRKANKKH